MKKAILSVVVLVALFAGLVALSSKEGIIALPGYEHGVVLCGQGFDGKPLNQPGEFHMFSDDGNMVTINWGHRSDSQVDELLSLARVECAKLK